MFAPRYFAPRYWAPTYWANAGAATPDPPIIPPGIRLTVFEADGTTHVGIVTDVLSASYGQDVNSIGSWSASIPADSPQAAFLSDRYRVQIDIGGEGYVFQGIVTSRKTRVQGENKILDVSGWSTARELVDLDTGQGFELESESLSDAFDAILDVEGTWATGTVGSPSLSVWSRRFDGVKLWQGLTKLADMFGVLFREDSRTREIDAGAFGDDSGLTFKNWEGPIPQDLQTTNPGLVLLNGIEVAIETQDIITRVEPFGQRQGITGDKVTLEHATDTTLYTTQTSTRNSLDYFYLVDGTAESAYGRIEATISVSDVLPLDLSATGLERSANALHGVAATWLSRRKEPLRTYTLKVEGLRHVVSATDTFLVGQKARVVYQGSSKSPDGTVVWLNLDEDLWIMGYRRTVTADGRSNWQIKVSNVTREVPDSTTKLAELYEQFEAQLTAPWPMITWGGTPPVGALTPTGIDVVATDSGDSFPSVPTAARVRWFKDATSGDPVGEVSAGYSTPSTVVGATAALRAFIDGFDTANAKVGVYDLANAHWTRLLAVQDPGLGLQPLTLSEWISGASTNILILLKTDDDNYSLQVRKDGVLTEVGAGMSLIVKEADETVNNSDALQNDDELLFAVAANEVWQFEGVLIINTDPSADFKMAATGPTGAVGSIAAIYGDTISGNADSDGDALGATLTFTSTAVGTMVRFWGGIHNGANAGNLTLQWAQNGADASDTKVLAGSYIKYQKET